MQVVGVPRVGREYLSFFTNLIIKKDWYVNELCGPQEGGQEWRQGSGALLRGVSNDELAKRLAFVSSLQVGDAQSVLVQLPDIIADYLASGRTVNIKGLGNFFPSITSEPVERIEDCKVLQPEPVNGR